MKLCLKYSIIDYPYVGDSFNGLWSKLSLNVCNSHKKVEKVIFDLTWDILPLLDWFKGNREALFNEKCPVLSSGKSIAFDVHQFYETLDESIEWSDMENQLIDNIYNYRLSHDIGFAIRGTNIRDIFIGLKGNTHTISFWQDEEKWEYEINLFEFYSEIEKIFNRCHELLGGL